MEQGFPLFELPPELVFKILKEYVPVTDKEGVLRRVAPFQPYLDRESLWFPATRALHRLANMGMRPGWHVDLDNLHNRYHVSVDFENLVLTIHSFSTLFYSSKLCLASKDIPMPLTEMETLMTDAPPRLMPLQDQKDILSYEYIGISRYVAIWILRCEEVVCWSENPGVGYRLKNRKCALRSREGRALIVLKLLDDGSIELMTPRVSEHSSMYELRALPRDWSEGLLYPLTFHVCRIFTTIEKLKECALVECLSCVCKEDASDDIHAFRRLVFQNMALENASALKQYFYQWPKYWHRDIIPIPFPTDYYGGKKKKQKERKLFIV